MQKFNIPITGIIENMSANMMKVKNIIYLGKIKEQLAKQFNTKIIAKLPIFSENQDDK